jgi:aromatic ring hydroxylase
VRADPFHVSANTDPKGDRSKRPQEQDPDMLLHVDGRRHRRARRQVWENVLFYRHTKAASFIRATLHRYSAFPFVQRILAIADMLIGAALFNARQTGLDKQQAVREKLAKLVCYRQGINAHLTAAIAMAHRSPAGLLMPHQSLLSPGACTRAPSCLP